MHKCRITLRLSNLRPANQQDRRMPYRGTPMNTFIRVDQKS